MPQSPVGKPMGHEFLGVVEELGSEVSGLAEGDWGGNGIGGGQAEAVRVPRAEGTLVRVPVGEDSPLLPSLLTSPTSRRRHWPAACPSH